MSFQKMPISEEAKNELSKIKETEKTVDRKN